MTYISLKMDMNTKTVANVKFKDWLMKNTKGINKKKLDYIFNQSNVNPSLRDATVNNYKPQNEKQVQAKQTAIEYVQGFSTKSQNH